MPRLTDTQLVILAAAAKREDGSIMPLPKKLKPDAGAAETLLKPLFKKGLVAEQPGSGAVTAWRQTADGQHMNLFITQAGLRAIGADPGKREAADGMAGAAPTRQKRRRSASPKARRPADSKPHRKSATRRPTTASQPSARTGSKLAKVTEMLRRSGGTSIAEMMKITGWQAHSVRGVLSGSLKKKLGLVIVSEKSNTGERRYRIATQG